MNVEKAIATTTCPLCEKVFVRIRNMRRHVEQVHKQRPPEKRELYSWGNCNSCGQAMRSARALKKDYPDTVVHRHKGTCKSCYQRITGMQNKEKIQKCSSCDKMLRPRGVPLSESPGTYGTAIAGKCRACWMTDRRKSKSVYIPEEDRIDLTAATKVRRLVEARYTGSQQKYMLDILGIGGDL